MTSLSLKPFETRFSSPIILNGWIGKRTFLCIKIGEKEKTTPGKVLFQTGIFRLISLDYIEKWNNNNNNNNNKIMPKITFWFRIGKSAFSCSIHDHMKYYSCSWKNKFQFIFPKLIRPFVHFFVLLFIRLVKRQSVYSGRTQGIESCRVRSSIGWGGVNKIL